MNQITQEEIERKRNVLKGPPGVLFGLTLLVCAVARVWFGWGPDFTVIDEDAVVANAVVTNDLLIERVVAEWPTDAEAQIP